VAVSPERDLAELVATHRSMRRGATPKLRPEQDMHKKGYWKFGRGKTLGVRSLSPEVKSVCTCAIVLVDVRIECFPTGQHVFYPRLPYKRNKQTPSNLQFFPLFTRTRPHVRKFEIFFVKYLIAVSRQKATMQTTVNVQEPCTQPAS
jgi:hypothetical protein